MALVCLIDDDHAVRRTLRYQLESSGHDVIEGSNGHEGLRLLGHHACDIVVVDMIMPEKEGLSTIIDIKQRFPHVRIVAITGQNPQYLKLARELGADAALSKPFRSATLIEVVGRLAGA